MKYSTVIFDLDGTLLDTITDLAGSANYALAYMGYPTYTVDEIKAFVGNGVRRLMEQCVPGGADNPKFEECFAVFSEHYDRHCRDNTRPYDGIIELLRELSRKEYKLAIVSNKPDGPVKALNEQWFGNYISVAIGEKPTVHKKPAPDTVLRALDELVSEKFESVYIGDSEVDILTAKNAGVDCINVSWGFRSTESLIENGATVIADKPSDILKLV